MTRVTFVDANNITQRGNLITVYESRNSLIVEPIAVVSVGYGKHFLVIPLSELTANESNH
jgi:hypothetical protein